MDEEQLKTDLLEIILFLAARPGEWVSIQKLAREIHWGKVPEPDYLLAILYSHSKLFTIRKDEKYVKLSEEGIRSAAPSRKGTSKPNETRKVEHPPHVDDNLNTTPESLAMAIRKYGESLRPVRVSIEKSVFVREISSRYIYFLHFRENEDEVRAADDTPVKFISADNSWRAQGVLVGSTVSEDGVFVSFDKEVGWENGTLEVDRRGFWRNLYERVLLLNCFPSLLSELGKPLPELVEVPCWNDSGAAAAWFAKLNGPWAKLLWGPPGSGKTFCVAQFCKFLKAQAEVFPRVLFVAPSNLAADQITKELCRVSELGSLLNERLILRFGYPKDVAVLEEPRIFGSDEHDKLKLAIAGVSRRLRADGDSISDEERATLLAEKRALQERLRKVLIADVAKARIVITTIASAVSPHSGILSSDPAWHYIILDEVSMVPPAVTVPFFEAAKVGVLLAGDPRQLPPLFESGQLESEKLLRDWLQWDMFQFLGLSYGEPPFIDIKHDARMGRIQLQRRSHPDIWNLVSRLYRDVRTDVKKDELDAIARVPPCEGRPVAVLDLSTGRSLSGSSYGSIPAASMLDGLSDEFTSACVQSGKSWVNPGSADIVVQYIRDNWKELEGKSVAVISPYRAQVRRLDRLIKEELTAKGENGPKSLIAGTVHGFQGSEADIVIFDLCDGPPRPTPGGLLVGDNGVRLLNVALTRARGKVVIVAHLDWIRFQCKSVPGFAWNLLSNTPGVKWERCSVWHHETTRDSTKEDFMSPIHKKLWEEICTRGTGLPKCENEFRLKGDAGEIIARADIAIPSHRIAIFCDGYKIHSAPDRFIKDMRQSRRLTRRGWSVLRFWGWEILGNASKCVDEIAAEVKRAERRVA